MPNIIYKGGGTNVFTLTDGSLLFVDDWISEPEYNRKYINIDINGIQKPNILGKDLFSFVIYNTGLKTIGFNDNNNAVKSSCITTGAACTTLIMRNGWKIPKDYPW